jgi:hypothetical protein
MSMGIHEMLRGSQQRERHYVRPWQMICTWRLVRYLVVLGGEAIAFCRHSIWDGRKGL